MQKAGEGRERGVQSLRMNTNAESTKGQSKRQLNDAAVSCRRLLNNDHYPPTLSAVKRVGEPYTITLPHHHTYQSTAIHHTTTPPHYHTSLPHCQRSICEVPRYTICYICTMFHDSKNIKKSIFRVFCFSTFFLILLRAPLI